MRLTLKKTSIYFVFIAMVSLHVYANAECIKGNCINGQGTFVAANGDKFVGEFWDGKYYGQGIFTWADGQKYEGEFSGNQANGHGIFTGTNGVKYVGMFEDNKYNGEGILTFPNGTIKSGVWKKGVYLGTKLEFEAKERDREAKERDREAKERDREAKEAKEKYDSIYLACLLDKSMGLDMQISDIRNAIEETCRSTAKNPSFLERFKYN